MSQERPAGAARDSLPRQARRAAATVYWWVRRNLVIPAFDALVVFLFGVYLRLKAGGGPVRCVVINGGRIGPLAERADAVLRFRARQGSDRTAWFGLIGEVCNPALAQLINGHLPLLTMPIAYGSLTRQRSRRGRFPGYAFEMFFEEYSDLYDGTAAPLALPDGLAARAESTLSGKYGIRQGNRFITFHARDEGYLQMSRGTGSWDHHSYRNSIIGDYHAAIDQISAKGLFAVRIGAMSSQRVSDDWGPLAIDYAGDGADPFIDVYLMARAEFAMIGGGSGIGHVAQAFGRPVIWTNFIPVFPWPWCADDLFVPKLLRRREDGRLLTFAELQDLGYFARTAGIGDAAFFRDRGLEVVDNSPEELAGAAGEMLARLRGDALAPELADLQAEFRRRFKPGQANGGNISADFLARHRDLL